MATASIWINGDFTAGFAGGSNRAIQTIDHATKIHKDTYYHDHRKHSIYTISTDTKKVELGTARFRDGRQAQGVRGLKGLTSYGRKMLRNSAFVLQQRYTRKKLSFGTATIPTVSDDDLLLINWKWDEIVRRFFEEIGRLLKRRGLPDEIVHCTEIQEERFKKTGQYCPHLHWVMPGRASTKDAWGITKEDIRNIWERILSNILERRVDCSYATRIEAVRHSACNYLSKYISKGCHTVAPPEDNLALNAFPHSWYGSTLNIRRYVKSKIIKLVDSYANEFINAITSIGICEHLFVKPLQKQVSEDATDIMTFGYWGQIKDSDLRRILTGT